MPACQEVGGSQCPAGTWQFWLAHKWARQCSMHMVGMVHRLASRAEHGVDAQLRNVVMIISYASHLLLSCRLVVTRHCTGRTGPLRHAASHARAPRHERRTHEGGKGCRQVSVWHPCLRSIHSMCWPKLCPRPHSMVCTHPRAPACIVIQSAPCNKAGQVHGADVAL